MILLTIPALLLNRMDDVNSILSIIIYLQFLLIWAQAEIALRQHSFSQAEFDPTFDIRFEESDEASRIVVYNLSDNPAYNLCFGPLMTWKHFKVIHDIDYLPPGTLTTCLPPKGKLPIITLLHKEDKEKIFLVESTLNITFDNRYGERKSLDAHFFRIPPSEDTIIIEYSRMGTPGILLGFFEDFRSAFMFLRSHTGLTILALLALSTFCSIIWHIYFNIYLKCSFRSIIIALLLVFLEAFLFWLMDHEWVKIRHMFLGLKR